MKLAFITDEVTQSFEDAVALAKDQGLAGLELRSVEDRPIDQAAPEQVEAWRGLLEREGLSVSNLASTFYKCDLRDGAAVDSDQEKLVRLCRIAEAFDCQTIRGFAFFQAGPLCQMLEEIVDAFARPLETLHKHNKCLLLEADPSVHGTNHRQLASILQALVQRYGQAVRPLIGAIYDPGNDVYDPEGEQPFPEGYRAIRPWLRHVHIKDAVQGPGGPECVRVGDGLVDYPGLLRALRSDGYEGWLSMETHYRAGRRIDEAAMRLPQGSDFSQGGLAAMVESIASLRRMQKEAAEES